MGFFQVFKMPSCAHVSCRNCAVNYFSSTLRDKPIEDAKCPFCRAPEDIESDETKAQEYFQTLGTLLESVLEKEDFALFKKKVREHSIMKDPNFR